MKPAAKRRPRILIVDDNPMNLKVLRVTLEDSGYEIVEAANGIEALALLAPGSISAVISDILMPGMDGYRLCREARRNSDSTRVPFILYSSSFTTLEDEKLAAEFGGDRFVRKPATAAVLLDVLRDVLENPAARGSLPPSRPEGELVLAYNSRLVTQLEQKTRELSERDEKREASEALLNATFDATSDAIAAVRIDNTFLGHNRNFLEMWNLCPSFVEAAAGQGLGPLLGPLMTDPPAFAARTAEIMAGLEGVTKDLLQLQDGRAIEMASLQMPGTHLGRVFTFRDLTGRKQLEQQILQAQKMEIVGQMTSGLAHDFNNLICVTMGLSEILLNQLGPESPLAEIAKTIFQASERAATLTNRLLLFSRREAMRSEILNVGKIVSDLDPILRQLAGAGIAVETNLPALAREVRADGGQIEQILLNLCVNARDAMPSGGKIVIGASALSLDETEAAAVGSIPPGDYIVMSVADNGSGIPEEIRARIFEPFFTTKPPGKGTGLGLATCQGIARHWGGEITVESSPDTGTVFRVYLPGVPDSKAAVPTAPLPGGSETVLVVEDDSRLRELTIHILERQGFKVTAVPNGGEAVRLIDSLSGAFDLVLSDIMMPEMGGREMATLLGDTHPDLKILFTSGIAEQKKLWEDSRGDNFIPKPFTPSALVQKVREIIDGPALAGCLN